MNSLISETEEKFTTVINHIGCMSEWQAKHILKAYLNCSAQQANSVLNNLKTLKYIDYSAVAKAYISGALSAMLDLGKGSGPMNHAFAIKGEY